MKYFLIIFFIIPFSGEAQTYSASISNEKVHFNKEAKLDTIKVVLLLCDTTYNGMPDFVTFEKPLPSLTWKFGYSVREKHNDNQDSNGDWICANCEDYWRHIFYLDDNKKPLNKNIIVWQSVKAKK